MSRAAKWELIWAEFFAKIQPGKERSRMKQRRETKQRQIILEVVQAHHDHPRADQIYEEVRQRDGRISRGTVYRNLSCLSDDGKICHVRVPGADRYDSRTDLHYHLICMGCGAVVDVPMDYQEKIDRMAAEKTGYHISRHRIVVEGLCPGCQEKEG